MNPALPGKNTSLGLCSARTTHPSPEMPAKSTAGIRGPAAQRALKPLPHLLIYHSPPQTDRPVCKTTHSNIF
ncbi:MAG: hypothetical protein H6581_26400 [Bacteroidia bacterium]|nr:hypothetical protein [Bacteroidia bacterium]